MKINILSFQDNEGRWIWPSGNEITVNFWGDDQPNNARNNENCACVVANGKMWDRDCDIAYSYACEKPSTTELSTATTTAKTTSKLIHYRSEFFFLVRER